jgi:hypothetical protein
VVRSMDVGRSKKNNQEDIVGNLLGLAHLKEFGKGPAHHSPRSSKNHSVSFLFFKRITTFRNEPKLINNKRSSELARNPVLRRSIGTLLSGFSTAGSKSMSVVRRAQMVSSGDNEIYNGLGLRGVIPYVQCVAAVFLSQVCSQ